MDGSSGFSRSKNVIQSYGRRLTKLRVSLLDACNFRCVYCMPDNASFCHKEDILSADEITGIVGNLTHFGIEEVRLTGGEPTLRSDLCTIVEKLNATNLKKISLTTNASQLKNKLKSLSDLNLKSINFSLDSLNADVFEKITGNNGLKNVLECISLAQQLGINCKINMVVMKGINHSEINNFVRYGIAQNIEVRFLEVMNIGVVKNNFQHWLYPGAKILEEIKTQFGLEALAAPLDSTAKIYQTDKFTKIGLIASESMPFCSGCSRLRLSPKGFLRACLMKEDGVNLRHVDFSQYQSLMELVASMKPTQRIEHVESPMYKIGG